MQHQHDPPLRPCPRGERAQAAVLHGHWKTSTFVAGLRHDGIVAPMVFDGAMNGLIFRHYINEQLAPRCGRAMWW